MKILISTPLFPPENHYPANFSKDFAAHLQKMGHDIVVTTFSNFPEKVEYVKIVHVRKDKNIFLRMVLFFYQMIKHVGKQEVVVLKQAGFSSFLTVLVAKVFRIKVILKMKEDEAEVRIERQKISPESFTIWRVKKLQKIIFAFSDLILFDSGELQNKICREYNLSFDKTKVLAQPVKKDFLPYDENIKADKQKELADWENYVTEFEKYAKNI